MIPSRKVIIRQDHDRFTRPLQIYKGNSNGIYYPHRFSVSQKDIRHRIETLLTDLDHQERSLDSIVADLNPSHSSRLLLESWETLSASEKRRLGFKLAAEVRSATPIDPLEALQILYVDAHLCVVNKPSGILAVPGPRRNPSLATAVYEVVQPPDIHLDQTIVHRLDLDTSGIIVYALTETALRRLHDDFRNARVCKTYQAILAGHVPVDSIEIDIQLERDPDHPPFMRIAQQRQQQTSTPLPCNKFFNTSPKPSYTELEVLQRFHLDGCPVTRVQLRPRTGRTHQLRVHTAALGYGILGDDIYSAVDGEGNCGVEPNLLETWSPHQRRIQKQLSHHLPLCLHAHRLSFHHPISGAPMLFECDPPF